MGSAKRSTSFLVEGFPLARGKAFDFEKITLSQGKGVYLCVCVCGGGGVSNCWPNDKR